jgi:SAM-dependent methyltransferase
VVRLLSLAESVAANPGWYHTMELAPGVVTPGHIDLRSTAPKVLPGELAGKKALDIGTFDGFWAFEMERRGADVVAIDVPTFEATEWPPLNRERLETQARDWGLELGRGFRIAAEALSSSVERVECPVQELGPERVGGPVDFVFSGAILLHLRDPVGALENIHRVLDPGGTLVILEPFSRRTTIRSPRGPVADFQPLSTPFNWWMPNLAALRAWLTAARFDRIERLGFHRPPSVEHMRKWMVGYSARAA